MSEWIAVDDKLPDDDRNVNEVLVQLNESPYSATRAIGHYYHGMWWTEKDGGYRVVEDLGYYVSHWQPLPELVRLETI